MKYSNYKVLKCYKLVFRKVTIIKNIGSILSNIYFIGYLISIGLFFYYKKLLYLQNEIEQLTKKDKNVEKNNSSVNKHDTISLDKKKYVENTDNLINIQKNKSNNIQMKYRKITKKKITLEYKSKNIKQNEILYFSLLPLPDNSIFSCEINIDFIRVIIL